MKSLRYTVITLALLAVATAAAAQPTQKRTVGQFIDDTAITTEIKAKLTSDKLSNLTKIEVKTANGVVTLNGTVDSADRAVRAEQIASSINGVQGVVNNIHVAGTTVHPPAGSVDSSIAQAPGDAIGLVAHVDSASGRITFQDGRVLQVAPGTVIWQVAPMQSVRPGTQVLVRGAAPQAVQPTTPQWRMGTVRSVDRARNQLVLTDGTLVRVAPYANVRRGPDRLALEQIVPGSEVAIRTLPPAQGSAEGSALPGHMVVIDAAEINVVWTPSARPR